MTQFNLIGIKEFQPVKNGLDFANRIAVLEKEPALHTHEWFFNREPGAFEAFVRWALPRTVLRPDEPLRILFAGCGGGEDAYTLAIRLQDRKPGTAPAGVRIHGIDAHGDLVEQAKRGEYDAWSLRRLTDTQRAWFRDMGRGTYLLDGWIRRGVTFEKRDPLREDSTFWKPNAYHAIFCRDILFDLAREKSRDMVDRFTASMVDGGHLFLRTVENLRGISSDYDLTQSGETFFYRRRERQRLAVSERPRLAS